MEKFDQIPGLDQNSKKSEVILDSALEETIISKKEKESIASVDDLLIQKEEEGVKNKILLQKVRKELNLPEDGAPRMDYINQDTLQEQERDIETEKWLKDGVEVETQKKSNPETKVEVGMFEKFSKSVRMAIAKSLSMGYEFFYLTSYPALVWVGGGDIDWSYDGNNRSIVYHWAGHNEDAIYLTGSEYKPLPHRLKSFVPPDNWHSEKWYTDQRELRKKIILQNKKQVKDREARYKQEELDRLRWDEDNNSKSVFENFIDWAINK